MGSASEGNARVARNSPPRDSKETSRSPRPRHRFDPLQRGTSAWHTIWRSILKKLSENGNDLCWKDVVASQFATVSCNRSPRHDTPQAAARAAGNDLGNARRLVESNRADPPGVLAQEGHRTQGRQLAEDAQRNHLSDAERLPMGPVARAVRPQEHRLRLVPTLGQRRHLRENLGGAGR